MRTIYIDEEFKCFPEDTGALRAVETDFFDGKCDAFLRGYRYIPEGEHWTRQDGTVFSGVMAAPWRDYGLLLELQRQYEANQAETADLRSALDTIYRGVT